VDGRAADQTKSRKAPEQEEAGVLPDGSEEQEEGYEGKHVAEILAEFSDAVAGGRRVPPLG
jgi:hypothetical protein